MVKKLLSILADTAAADAAREKRRSHNNDGRQITDSNKIDVVGSKQENSNSNDVAASSTTDIESPSSASSQLEQTRENDFNKSQTDLMNKSSSSLLQKQKQSKEDDTESTVSMTENTSFDCSEDDDDHRSVPSTYHCSSTHSRSTYDSPRRPTKVISLPVSTVSEKCPRKRNQRVLVNGQWGQLSGPTAHQGSSQKGACVLQGCVVRFEETHELYVGSLNRLDTGSFTFHHPGTLYDSQGSPLRRVR
mmetsp:Transcript_61320/g.150090  ORF Transcript_61320/g.150090 Transcript_61320/m.150090 type:complete len:247 (+) Transcript_61320:181-921(+)